ncbi:nucleolar complex protein 4 homolog B-like [Saccostrea echinata]|uniref:nucleolar complex protein 4 homolog B-like n=1 Tax=Saccostrea echinata TaxID=191078 RepID=UPI002A80F73A|nr:nucleolar complex protein 4 homolog B-like [Saccostrea echinata]
MVDNEDTCAISEIKSKTQQCFESRKHANCLLDIIAHSETNNKAVLLACVRSFHKLFTRYLSSGELFLDIPSNLKETDLTKEEKYKGWLKDRYKDVCNRLIQLVHHENSNIRELSLCTLMKFVLEEGQFPVTKHSPSRTHFPLALFRRVVHSLTSDTVDVTVLISRFQEYLAYDDVRYHLMRIIHKQIATKAQDHLTDVCLNNIVAVLEQISFTADGCEELSNFMTKYPEREKLEKIKSLDEQRRIFTNLWIDFLQLKLPNSVYKKVLIILHDKVMPHLTNPLYLSDFLTASYDVGGAISLLALNSLFILVHKHNLDYPDFYQKLYALFEPGVLHVKYRARFFYLADLFLSSTHLPAAMVAAFAKRLARISLTAPASALMVTIPFIYNLISRHPNCKILIHRESPTELQEDPYCQEEPDPVKSKAIESSLWELKTLQSHYHPDVAKKAQRMDQPITKEEIPLADLLETSYNDLFVKETKKKVKHAPMNFNPPEGIMGLSSDKLNLCWTLE